MLTSLDGGFLTSLSARFEVFGVILLEPNADYLIKNSSLKAKQNYMFLLKRNH